MKFAQLSLVVATLAVEQASSIKLFRGKNQDDSAAVNDDANDAANESTSRELAATWYPVYTGIYNTGWCNSPAPAGVSNTYSTQLACCKGAFGDQTSGYCLMWLDNPPTAAPTATGGPDAWYRDNAADFADGTCINKAPVPNGRKAYTTQAECCAKEYGTQTSGTCFASMVTPPTAAPTALADKKWFKDPLVTDFAKGVCINDGPAPDTFVEYTTQAECCAKEFLTQTSGYCYTKMDNPPTAAPTALADKKWFRDPLVMDFTEGVCTNDGPAPDTFVEYATNAECCTKEFASQISGACFADMAFSPTAAPTAEADRVWYPDYDTPYEDATCISDGNPNGRPTYATNGECCIKAYADQSSGACFGGMAKAPTAAPTSEADIKYYPDYDTDYDEATCLSGDPPNGVPVYSTYAECCAGAYPDQSTGACYTGMDNSPTAAPTSKADIKWYPDYDSDYDEATCLSGGNSNGRPTYSTQAECCLKAYPDQTSGACFASMDSKPTAAPTSETDKKWYPDWSKAWVDGVCISGNAPVSGYTFDTQAECCSSAYAGQSSGVCFATMDNAPTAAPFSAADLVFYPVYTGNWATGYCDNDPAKAPVIGTLGVSIFTTQTACCDMYFPGQPARFCKRRAPKMGTLAPTPTPVYKYYPKWGNSIDAGRCLNDGLEPTGVSLYTVGKDCCEANFKKYDGSVGISGCLLALGFTNAPTTAPTPQPTHKPVDLAALGITP